MNNDIKISIIIPVYNVEKYINRCMDSIINQRYKNLEIIVVNDGSTDQSGKICSEYAKSDNRIILINQENQGVSKAKNVALELSTGKYVMFVDPDDYIELNTCDELLKLMEKNNYDLLIYNFSRDYDEKSIKNELYITNNSNNLKEKIQALILSHSIKISDFKIRGAGYCWNKIYLRDKIINNRFPFEDKKAIYEDVLFNYYVVENMNNIGICNNYFYHYCIRKDSITHTYNEDYLDITSSIYNDVKRIKENKKINDKELFEQSLYGRMIFNFCFALNVNIFNKKNELKLRKRLEIIKKIINDKKYANAIKNIDMINLTRKMKIYVYWAKKKSYFMIFITNKLEHILKLLIRR